MFLYKIYKRYLWILRIIALFFVGLFVAVGVVLYQLDFARVFREKGGFDIVIGNPPYLESRSPNFSNEIFYLCCVTVQICQ